VVLKLQLKRPVTEIGHRSFINFLAVVDQLLRGPLHLLGDLLGVVGLENEREQAIDRVIAVERTRLSGAYAQGFGWFFTRKFDWSRHAHTKCGFRL
jgi:hypothetical protein